MGERFGGFIREEVCSIPNRHCPVSRPPPVINEDRMAYPLCRAATRERALAAVANLLALTYSLEAVDMRWAHSFMPNSGHMMSQAGTAAGLPLHQDGCRSPCTRV